MPHHPITFSRPCRRLSWAVNAHASIAGIAALLLTGCAASTPERFSDPVAAMLDPSLKSTERQAAMQQAAEVAPDSERRLEGLKAIMSADGQSLETRIAAFDLLAAHDPELARYTLMMRLPSIEHYEFVAWASARAAAEGWTEYTPALVRSLDRPMPGVAAEERAEAAALRALHPGRELREIVFEVVATPSDNALQHLWRLSAWNLFVTLGDAKPLLALVEQAHPEDGDVLLNDVRAGARDFGVLPRTREELKWLQFLRLPEQSGYWQEVQAAFAAVPAERRGEISMRHLAVVRAVAAVRPEWLQASRSELQNMATARLSGREQYRQNRGMEGFLVDEAHPQTLEAWAPQMSWGDLLALLLADEIIQRPDIQATLLAQAERDRADRTTEHGGVIDWAPAAGGTPETGGRPEAIPFYPRYRRNDETFQTSQLMLERGYTAPFHYHFHVQEVDNRAYAGPGWGDLQYADAMGVTGLVFTSVGRSRLNADLYAPGNVVIDLGEVGAGER